MSVKSTNKSLPQPDALSCLDRINSAIVDSADLDEMLPRILDELLDIFQADRAWFMFPCDPQTNDVSLKCERCRPEWPGLALAGGFIPASDETKAFLALCHNTDAPIRFDPEQNPVKEINNETYDAFHVKSQLALPLRPSKGPNWVLAIQHCSEAFVYDRIVPLFHAVGKRIANGLSAAMAFEDLQESETRYRGLVDNASESICAMDLATDNFTDANPMAAKLLGRTIEELCFNYGPKDFWPEFQPDGQRSVEKITEYMKAALNGGLPKFEWLVQNANGDLIPCDVSLGRIPHPTRELIRGTYVDVSERKAAEVHRADLEKRLAQTQRLESVGHMTGGVAHDFNNLLSVILGNLELLLLDGNQSDDAKELIQNSIDNTLKGASLTKNMLSFARRADLTPRRIQLSKTIEEVKGWGGRAIPATIELKLRLADNLWPVMADLASTQSAILNLVLNARDAMQDAGTLTIESCNLTVSESDNQDCEPDLKPGNYVMLSFSDTGEGIAPDNLAHVFEPFFTTKPTGKGSGLGLSMIHGFMKQSHGSVWICSKLGVGTTVKLLFPALNEAEPEESDVVNDVTEPGIPPIRILLAEDQHDVIKVMSLILTRAGHKVVEARSGDIAFELFKEKGPFDLLLTDVVMPGILQGPMLAQAIRTINPALPIIFMTGYAGKLEKQQGGLNDNDVRLMKPVSRKELLDAIRLAIHPEPEDPDY